PPSPISRWRWIAARSRRGRLLAAIGSPSTISSSGSRKAWEGRPAMPARARSQATARRAKAPRILVSNDDGIFSPGISALAAAMEPLGEVWVVAPDREQSAASHALSLDRPLRLSKVKPRWFSVDGTPSDCSYLALNHLLKDAPPSLMVSGINHGANLADDVTYSGTVAAAMEACLLGVPAIAFS